MRAGATTQGGMHPEDIERKLAPSGRLSDCHEMLLKPMTRHCKEATGSRARFGEHSGGSFCRFKHITVIDKRRLGNCKDHSAWDSMRLTIEDLERQDGEDVQEADPAAGHSDLHGSEGHDRCTWPLHALLAAPFLTVQGSGHCRTDGWDKYSACLQAVRGNTHV